MFFYFQPYYFELALMYLFLMRSYNSDIENVLIWEWEDDKWMMIWNIQWFTIKLNKPSWWNNKNEYWGSKWVLLEVLRLLEENSNEKEIDHKKSEIELTFSDVDFFMTHSWEVDNFWVFEAFDSLFINELITNITINFLKDWKIISSKDLSEWERQNIIINWLKFYFWDNSNSLFLMDEPDNYLHPNWQKEFIPSLLKTSVDPYYWNDDKICDNSEVWKENVSHFIINTHSPLLVWSSENIDIIWLENINWKAEIICHTNPELFEENENIEKIDVYWNRAEFIYEKLFLDEWKTTRADKFEEEISKLHNLLKKKSEWNSLDDKENKNFSELKNFLKSKIWDDLDDLYLSYLSIDELSALIKEKNEKDK